MTRTTGPTPTIPAATAVIYARVSSKDQEREGFSIPAQQKLLREYAGEHRLTIVREFVDVETAKQAGRGGFGEMLIFLKADPSCRTILVEKTDRLYRNIKDWIDRRRARRRGPFRQGGRDRLEGFALLRQVHARHQGADGQELRGQPERGGQEGPAREGRTGALARTWPMSATSTIATRRRIDVDPVRGPLVARVFELYATGDFSLKALRQSAPRDRPTPLAAAIGRMAKSELHRMLKNPIYIGDFRWLGKIHQGFPRPAGQSHDTFERVQAVLRRQTSRPLPRSTTMRSWAC